jgi:ferredoxin
VSRRGVTLALRIVVDRLRCIGAGNCMDTAPDVFQLDENHTSVIVNPLGATPDVILAAAEACPVDAIKVIDDKAGQQLYP